MVGSCDTYWYGVFRIVPCTVKWVRFCLFYAEPAGVAANTAPLSVTGDAMAAPVKHFPMILLVYRTASVLAASSRRLGEEEKNEKAKRGGKGVLCVMEHDVFGLVVTLGILLGREPTSSFTLPVSVDSDRDQQKRAAAR